MSSGLEVNKEIQVRFLPRASLVAAPFGVLAFWCGLLMAAQPYPSGYDWRSMSVSHLVSPERNPVGYLWAAGGIAICGLCGLLWVSVLAARSRAYNGVEDRPRGIKALQFGFFFMICAAALPKWLVRIEKGHEALATLAFAGLLVGLVRLTFQTAERTILRSKGGVRGHARLYAFILATTAISPIVLAGMAQAYFYYVPPEFHRVGFSWSVRGWPVILRFAFWEWVTCVVLSAYMVVLCLATYAVYPLRKPEEGR